MQHLVTGGAGFVGSHLVDRLLAAGDSVVVLDDLSTGSRENLAQTRLSGRVRFIEGSTTDAELVDELMREVDSCFHLAAAVGVQLIMRDPLNSVLSNVRGADNILASASRHDRRLIFASTSEIYGMLDEGPLNENSGTRMSSPFRARWNYAISKSFGEAAAFAYIRDRGAAFSVIRLFNIVGPRQTPAYGMVLPRFVAQALDGDPLTIFGDGTHVRSFTSVHDVVDGLTGVLAEDRSIGRVFNLGGSEPVRVIDLAQRVIERTGSHSETVFLDFEHVYGPDFEETASRVSDTTALRELIGWFPKRGLDEMIDEVVAERREAMRPRLQLHRRRLTRAA